MRSANSLRLCKSENKFMIFSDFIDTRISFEDRDRFPSIVWRHHSLAFGFQDLSSCAGFILFLFSAKAHSMFVLDALKFHDVALFRFMVNSRALLSWKFFLN